MKRSDSQSKGEKMSLNKMNFDKRNDWGLR